MSRHRFLAAYLLVPAVLCRLFVTHPVDVRAFTTGSYPITEYGGGGYLSAAGLVAGADGDLWTTDYPDSSVIRLSPSGNVIAEYALPGKNPYGITAGPDGNIWFLESQVDTVARITPTGTISEFPVPGSNVALQGDIAPGPDGNVWFVDAPRASVGKVTPAGTVTEYQLPAGRVTAIPAGLTTGPDGNIWVTDAGNDRVDAVTPSGAMTAYSLASNTFLFPSSIATGWDGSLWIYAGQTHELIKFNPTDGSFSRLGPLSTCSNATDVARVVRGPDGNVWFTYPCADAVGMVTPGGSTTLTTVPTQTSWPNAIAVGPDGNVWFTEAQSGKIGRLSVPMPENPGTPLVPTAKGGDGFAYVRWQPPAYDGGAPITSYNLVSAPSGRQVTVSGDQQAAIVPDLVNGEAAAIRITAVNSVGSSYPASTALVIPEPFTSALTPGRPWTGGTDAAGIPAAATDFYFAEGYTGAGFQEYLTMLNQGPTNQAAVVTYMFSDGASLTKSYQLVAGVRTTIDVNQEVGPDHEVSVHVHAAGPVVVERPMYFNYQGRWTGGDDVVGATSLSTTYYFAEGYTGAGFNEYLTLMNPNSTPALVDIDYMLADGTVKTVAKTIASTSRDTVNVNDPTDGVGPGNNVAIMVTSHSGNSVTFLAERSMYFNYQNRWTGGSDVVGSTALSQHLDLAEGYVAPDQFDEYLTFLNPGSTDATATVTVECQAAGALPPGTLCHSGQGAPTMIVGVPAHSRATSYLNNGFRGQAMALSVHIESTQPLVVERPMYFNYQSKWTGGHDVFATDSAALTSSYIFAEGYVAANFDEYLTVLNNNAFPITVTINYSLAEGFRRSSSFNVASSSRGTYLVNQDFGVPTPLSISVSAVESGTTAPATMLVERPMYFAY